MACGISIEDDKSTKLQILKAVKAMGGMSALLSLFGPNPLLCVPAFIALYFIVDLLFISKWVTGFLVAFVYQWVQVSIKVLYATYSFTDILSLTAYPNHIISCYLLCCVGFILITWSISVYLKKINVDEKGVELSLQAVNLKKLIISYFSLSIIASLLPYALQQVAMLIAAFKWGLFFVIFIKTYNDSKRKWLLLALIAFEFLIGFASYFSSWKNVIFYTGISYLSVARLNARRVIGLGIAAVALVYLGLIWTGIKGDFRSYVSQGNKQTFSVSKMDAYVKVADLIGAFEANDAVIKSFIDRVSYIDYFSACMNHVPAVVPHEYGKLTGDALAHVLVPRALNKSKAIIDESTHLTKYTGVFFSNLSMGVSFSLGYFGDFYVDFGEVGMLMALFVYGLLIGYAFKYVYDHINDPLLGVAVLQMSFILLFKFEISLIKLTGSIVLFTILYRLLGAYVFPKFTNWLMIK